MGLLQSYRVALSLFLLFLWPATKKIMCIELLSYISQKKEWLSHSARVSAVTLRQSVSTLALMCSTGLKQGNRIRATQKSTLSSSCLCLCIFPQSLEPFWAPSLRSTSPSFYPLSVFISLCSIRVSVRSVFISSHGRTCASRCRGRTPCTQQRRLRMKGCGCS